MILHRFMSEREFERYQNGEVLENNTDHRKNGEHTDSVGFCFFPEEPDDAIRWLSGIVTDDVCATFDVPGHLVRESCGTYCDPDASDNSLGAMLEDLFSAIMGDEMGNTVRMEKVEHCCTEYSNETFRLLGYKYSEEIITLHRVKAEWERPEEELPEGVLLQGTASGLYGAVIFDLLRQALKKTPLCRGNISLDRGSTLYWYITLPDGRIISEGDAVEVHDDGIVLINGKLYTKGFPRLSFNTDCSLGDAHWRLRGNEGCSLEVPESLYRKYEAAMREGR